MATTVETTTATSCHQPCRSSTCPPWLQAALADIEKRVRALAVTLPDEDDSHCFAERAENYYQKRPQLLSLLRDLHNRYLYLADRYSQSLLRSHHHQRKQITSVQFESDDDGDPIDFASSYSDAESSLSFQLPPPASTPAAGELDRIVAELVMAAVERDLLAAEAAELDRQRSESSRKIELQGSLLEVLESERMVLLTENARLGFEEAAAEEATAAMAAELAYMRRKATELARMVVKLREDHRVCIMGRRIEGLQKQIYGLEKRNRECSNEMARKEAEMKLDRAEMDWLREENRRLEETAKRRRRRRGKAKGWGWVRKMEWSPCVPHVEKGKGGWFCL
ncbi:kinase-interacting family protein-like [Typha angustifolia]|uniref:kinase-interacting family protein-like n=1 Tax=Typha angustifolia TaxID=59011 RepID=UPI003C2E29C4